MHVVMISENDPAGMGIAFSNAINTHTVHQCRLITTKTRYNFDFQKDLHAPDLDRYGWEEADQILREADIIHFHILADENLPLGPLKISEYLSGKRILHHHHGHPDFRSNPDKYREKYKELKRQVIVATPDLLKLIPEAKWQPNIVPINDDGYLPNISFRKEGVMRVGHAPTRRDLKNTSELVDTVRKINDYLGSDCIELDLIENCNHRRCLARKNSADIIFDHMQGYFGVSSLESLSQGKAVLAGVDSWNSDHIKRFTGCEKLPWLVVRTIEDLYATLLECLQSIELTEAKGRWSRVYMEKWWNDSRVVENLVTTYRQL